MKKTGFVCFLDLMGKGDNGWWGWGDWVYVKGFEMIELIVVVLILFQGIGRRFNCVAFVALLQRRFGACYFVPTRAILRFILFWCLFYGLFWMQWMLLNGNKAKFLLRKIFSKITARGTPCIRLSLHHEKHIPTCILAYSLQYCFLWSACHVKFSHTKFQIGIGVCHVTFLQSVWIKPHSSSLTNEANLTTRFGQSVQICCRKKKGENNGNCKSFFVTRKSN